VIGTQRPRPVLGHPAERLARLVPVAEFLRHHPQIVRDLHHQRIGVPQPPLTGRVGFLQHPPGSHRIVGLLQNRPKLMRSNQYVRIILGQVDFPQLNGALQHSTRPSQIATTDESLRALPGRQKRGRLRHARHAARNVPQKPIPRLYTPLCPPATLPAPVRRARVQFSPVRPAGLPIPGG
jgi:hypothetical protein